jgi:hypothetical protein
MVAIIQSTDYPCDDLILTILLKAKATVIDRLLHYLPNLEYNTKKFANNSTSILIKKKL